ncbi:MAG: GTP-binding protein, partial [Acinetobacter calcoaceticus]
DQGWKTFNFNPQQFNYKSGEEGIDNRIEMISQHEHDWLAFETDLLNCRIED